jgi:hypothetical protein
MFGLRRPDEVDFMRPGIRVRYIGRDFENSTVPHPVGTTYREHGSYQGALVVFDKPHRKMHDGDLGPAYKDRCWNCLYHELEILEDHPQVVANGVVEVTFDGTS